MPLTKDDLHQIKSIIDLSIDQAISTKVPAIVEEIVDHSIETKVPALIDHAIETRVPALIDSAIETKIPAIVDHAIAMGVPSIVVGIVEKLVNPRFDKLENDIEDLAVMTQQQFAADEDSISEIKSDLAVVKDDVTVIKDMVKDHTFRLTRLEHRDGLARPSSA